MMDRLYLLKPNFIDQGKSYFCPGCAQVEGMLSFYPALREKIDVHYIEFPRPRLGLVAEVGEENQSCPKLVLRGGHQIPQGLTVGEGMGNLFISVPLEICRYLASAYGVGEPH
ncbi:MAG: DUF3088 family protein [Syntrophales bacterium]